MPENRPQDEFNTEEHKTLRSDRPDGRHLCARGFVHHRLRELHRARPLLAFDPELTKDAFLAWQARHREKMRELMRFPEVPPQPSPALVSEAKRQGYTLQRWEVYPQPACVVPVLMLAPDGVSEERPAPAVLCFPGSKGTKETLAGEDEHPRSRHPGKNSMAKFYAQAGMVSVAVDNPGFGETADIGYAAGARELLSLYLLKTGWHYWGMAVFNAMRILEWMKQLGFVDASRIALSGHSCGVGPIGPLAVLDPDIRAVVNNDNLSDGLRRELVTTKPDENGNRPYPSNPLRNCVPGAQKWFGNLDTRAALAPRHALYTEGGNQADLDLLRRAYRIMDAEDRLAICHHAKFRDPAQRLYDYAPVPEGITESEHKAYANADGEDHFFHADIAVPWMKQALASGRGLNPLSARRQ